MKFTKSAELKDLAVVAIPALTIIGFFVDLKTSQGIDDWIWYFMALILTIFLQKRYLPFILTAVFTALTCAGFYFSPSGTQVTANMAIINLFSGIGVMWVTATMIFFQQRLDWEWHKSEKRYSSLFKNMQAGFAHCRMVYKDGKPVDFIYLSVNPAFGQITGLNGVVGRRVSEVIPGIRKANPELFETYGKVASSGKPKKFEYYLETSKVWLNVSAYSPGKGYFVTTFEDVTERKRAEGESNLFRALIDRSSDGIDVVDPETGLFHDVNETTCRQLGYTRDEMLTKRVTDVETTVKPEAWSGLVQNLRQRRAMVVEGGLRRKDGAAFPVEVNLRWVEMDREYIVAVVRDITERKHAEATVRKSHEQLLSLVEQAPISIAMLDRNMRYIITSRRWISDYGRGRDNLTGVSHYELNPDLPEHWKNIHQRGLAGEFLEKDEECWVQADGSKLWLRWAVHPWRDALGEIGGIIISTDNITERKNAEDEVRQSEDRLRMVTENARVGLVMINRERRYTFANGAYYEILGLPTANILGCRVPEVLQPVYEEQIRPHLDRAFAGERVSYELKRPARGEERFFAVKYEPMKADGIVSRVVVVITDITEQKRAAGEIQKQLDELRRWHEVMIGREDRILGLKREINELLDSRHEPLRYTETSKL
jgi:PAS domain S-box-containing protein